MHRVREIIRRWIQWKLIRRELAQNELVGLI